MAEGIILFKGKPVHLQMMCSSGKIKRNMHHICIKTNFLHAWQNVVFCVETGTKTVYSCDKITSIIFESGVNVWTA